MKNQKFALELYSLNSADCKNIFKLAIFETKSFT